MNIVRTVSLTAFALLFTGAGCAAPEPQNEVSVKPGINEHFQGRIDVDKWVKTFEGDDRDIFKYRASILAAVKPERGATVADIGAGTGFFSLMFAKAVGPNGKVYAVDTSTDFLSHIDQEVNERKLNNIVTVHCKEDSVELPPNSIDLAFICDTYHHFEYPHSTLHTLHRAMKPNGEVFIIDFFRDSKRSPNLKEDHWKWVQGHVRLDRDETIREVTAAGFKEIPAPPTPFLKENYLIRFRKAS